MIRFQIIDTIFFLLSSNFFLNTFNALKIIRNNKAQITI